MNLGPVAKRKKVYISGPMTGLPEFNYPAFHEAEEILKASGWEVLNPARNFNGETHHERKDYLRLDVADLLDADAIFMLPGWQNSYGARIEYQVAQALELDIKGDDDGFGAPIEFAATQIVRNGERQQAYGHPRDDFERTAAMWSGIIGKTVSAQDVALMMAALKISRLIATPGHRDSVMDLIGYTICYSRLDES